MVITSGSRARLAVAGVGAALVISAPTTAAVAAPPPAAPLIGTQWKLESSGFARTAPQPYRGSPAHFTLTSNQISGDDGCNATGGVAVVHGNRVSFGPLVSTMRACFAPGAQMIFSQAFRNTRTAAVVGNRLRLNDGPRGYWVFVAQRRR